MSSITSDLNKLKQICQIPKLYLANYFSDLRRDIDLEFSKKLQINNHELSIWNSMIDKINSFEQECISNINLNAKQQEFIQTLDSIHDSIQKNDSNHDEKKKLIQNEEINILKYLFKNKSIAYTNNKLIIISDAFIFDTSNEKVLNNSLIKLIQLKKEKEKKPINEYILEINLNLNKLKDLELRFYETHELTENLFDGLINLKELVLSTNNINHIGPNAFRILGNLTVLFLINNKISELNANALEGLVNLKELYLNENELKKINKNAFKGLDNLKKLDLSYNRLSELNPRLFEGLNNLKELSLSRNCLEYIHLNAFQCIDNLIVFRFKI
jgi:Leucine-rich repeat (LRR) protein